ncbi:mannose 6-phosphate receptor domain-containing protein [Eremomyces bilateralis CBS 781.70]|uniref:Mannose 6-phosphate receptor domain-containing protein n=1 Tax=Eremomyces bilateralis CBS 781.70 TaxID=1392243 RepID=A0A6G1GEF4_9PEZI|nr:mannose 6-phosphate receptor domain-containing protein [Eremomyces bilateralis CBS 781.70]KAF1816438.1 mannose 6-phosphate receptor domain-containing protein [Eremomyces bilateralis CBS 781.70]
MKLPHLLPLSLALLTLADNKPPKPPAPCTIRSHSTGTFFDLNPIAVHPVKKALSGAESPHSWRAKGYHYAANFSVNFCAPVVEEVKDVVGVEKGLWGNVSAFYEMGGKVYSLGNQNTEPVIQGRNLILNYTNGSPCPSPPSKRQLHIHTPNRPKDKDSEDKDKHDDDDDDDDDDKKPDHKKPSKDKDQPIRRKAALIHLLCDRDPLAPKVALAFLGTLDECTYSFAARSMAACGGVLTPQQTLSPGGVFGVIALIAVLVYLVGGCVYQRSVLHQRGWRQMPNYSMWAGCLGFFVDIFVIATSSCARLLPRNRGYSRVSLGNQHRGRGTNSEDENRLIDQLDEEWDD